MITAEQWRARAARASTAGNWALRGGVAVVVLAMLGTRFALAAVDEATAAGVGIWFIGAGALAVVASVVLKVAAKRMRARGDDAETGDAARERLRAQYPDADDATIDRILGRD